VLSILPVAGAFAMNETDDLMTEVQELTWAMIDEEATDGDVERLEKLLLDNDEARQVYVTCVQMHVDLQFLLGGKRVPLPKLPRKSAQQRKPAKARNPLPLVDMPSMCGDVPMVNGFLP